MYRSDNNTPNHHRTILGVAVNAVPNFIDFRQAFDSVDRETIWQLLHHYGIPQSFITLIQQLYEGATCQIIHNSKLTEDFEVRTGVRQGCMLSPMIFLLVVDWVMHQTTKTGKTGIQWSLTQFLEDLDFADDLCLMSQKCQHMQQKTDNLAQEASKTGLQINLEKTEIMTLLKKAAEANHPWRQRTERSHLFHLPGQHCISNRGL